MMIYDFELDGYPILEDARPPRNRVIGSRIMNGIVILAIIFVVGLLLIPAVPTRCGEAARRAQCGNNLKQIALALASYQEKFGSLPPAYVADANGRPIHSWRVLILPFLEQSALYDRYDFREPWDGPHNIGLVGEMPWVYACPTRQSVPRGLSGYAVITGPGTMFPGRASIRLADVKDGLDRTLMVVETAHQDVPWTAPVDLDVRTMDFQVHDPNRPGIASKHTAGGANVACGDTHVHFLKENTAAETLRSWITIAGGEADPRGEGMP